MMGCIFYVESCKLLSLILKFAKTILEWQIFFYFCNLRNYLFRVDLTLMSQKVNNGLPRKLV